MLCPLFEEIRGSARSIRWKRSGSGLRWKQSLSSENDPRGPLVRLVALESSLGNKTDGWVNLTQEWQDDWIEKNYYYHGPSYYSHLVPNDRSRTRHQVNFSVRITRQEAAAGMWSPEPIKVPCLVENEAFELFVEFKPVPGALRMSALRGWGLGISRLCQPKLVVSSG